MALIDTFPLDSKQYGFENIRYALTQPLQEGVIGANDYKPTVAATLLKVDIAAGLAFVQGDSGTRNGLYSQVNDAAVANAVTLDPAHATLPRIDRVYLQVNDATDLGSGSDTPAFAKVSGTATAGATLDNANGANNVPNNALHICDVLVPAAATNLVAGNLRDRRKWARGAFKSITRTANASAGTNYTRSGAAGLVDAVNMQPRIECGGTVVRVKVEGQMSSTSSFYPIVLPFVDGVAPPEAASDSTESSNDDRKPLERVWDVTVTPGSHLIGLAFGSGTSGGTTSLMASPARPLQFSVEEMMRPNASND